ncbi:histidine--tRNA ligase [Candidatus Roizmanbacteria bacterium RIFCSPLOWO2_01_FULL_44_13]|uniref:Histidine--tRNA ligase n=1 Tax=Candidatus Roizmanbacteria bacterium RIFCSPLOWO2_01_FULL_44_13 TaxID=1802069 RepID=A0A1F7JB80_9BACT|nr:MAG: histidine--tRNA ligase [Candidatus Roizmanbacteria bacterium RIFCSPLOWO2_01_FULL_44_13]
MDKKIKPQNLKGFRDFLPSQALARGFVIGKIKDVFEKFGFDPLETPALEYAETLLGKYGEDADRMIYLFEDRGKRRVGLRYDQTVPLARVIAQYQTLPKPFKRYQIQPVWRAENTQKGRFREFMQCDIDTIGSKNILADAEIINAVMTTVKSLGFKNAKMLINDRSIFASLKPGFIVAIDKLVKVGKEGVTKELVGRGMKKNEAEKLIDSFDSKRPTALLNTLFESLKQSGLKEGVDFEFSPTLARGLDYYTGTIFELVVKDYEGGSLGGGGRYDKLIGQFIGTDVPATGFAFGFDRLVEAMAELDLLPKTPTATSVLVTIFSQELLPKSLSIVTELRNNNVNADIVLDAETKLDKQLKYANNKGIPYVVIVGSEEVKKNVVKLKDMKTGEQKELTIEDCIALCK